MLEGFAEALEMDKTLIGDNQRAEQKPEPGTARRYEPEEFDADTTEERPVALLAERRRQFLAGLKARQTEVDAAADRDRVIRAVP